MILSLRDLLLFTIIAIGVPGLHFILIGQMDCDHRVAALVLLYLSMGFIGFDTVGSGINHVDVATK